MEQLLNKTSEERSSDSFTTDAIANSIREFVYNSDVGTTVSAYYRRYEGIFKRDCLHWNDEKKVHLLLRKLSPLEHEKYANFLLPKIPYEISFDETVLILPKIFWK